MSTAHLRADAKPYTVAPACRDPAQTCFKNKNALKRAIYQHRLFSVFGYLTGLDSLCMRDPEPCTKTPAGAPIDSCAKRLSVLIGSVRLAVCKSSGNSSWGKRV